MTSIGLIEAWTQWMHHPLPIEDTHLYGLKLFWWARIGKLLECLAGATIVADIIGSDRLREFGKSLHQRFTFATYRQLFKDSVAWYLRQQIYLRLMWSENVSDAEADRATNGLEEYQASKINRMITIPMMFIAFLCFHYLGDISWGMSAIFSFPMLVLGFVTVCPIVTLASIFVALLLGLLFDLLFFIPVAWVLERPALERRIKIFSLALLLVGFHFDFLTS